MKVVQITDHLDPHIIKEHLEDSIDFVYGRAQDKKAILEVAKDAEVLISIYEEIDRDIIDALEKLQFIAVGSIGYNFVDIAYARQKGIVVANNPNYCVEEVADHTMGLLLDRVRRISAYNDLVKKEGQWSYGAFGNTLWRLKGKKMGLIGFGKIGKAVAKRAQAFGLEILAYDPYLEEEEFLRHGAQKSSLERIQEEAHILSLHLPLTKETYHMVDRDFLARIKKPIILINTARGAIVDQTALKEALDTGSLSALAIDVLDQEEPDLQKIDFLPDSRVLISPHAAFYSRESTFDASYFVARHINLFLKGQLKELPIVN